MIALDFFTQWMLTASVGALCLLAATILGVLERRASRKRR